MDWKKIMPLIGIVIFVYLVNKIGFDKILDNFKSINYFYFVISILIIPVVLIFQTVKWMLILREQGIKLGFRKSFKIYLISLFYSLITPARLGAVLRANYMVDEVKKPWSFRVSSVVLERILDLIVIFCLAIGGVIILSDFFGAFLPSFIIAVIAFGVACVLLLNKKISRFILRRIFYILVPSKLREKSKNFFDSFYESLPKLRKLVFPLFFTFITWCLVYLQSYMVARSFGIDLSWWIFLFLVPIGTIVVMIPISVSGLGTREATLVFLMSFFGIASDKIVAFSIVAFVVNLIVPMVMAVGYSLGKKELKDHNL